MIIRHFWKEKIEEAWQKRSIVWLSGVRRVGKTFICKSFADSEYFDLELPRTRRLFEDPESFLAQHKKSIIIFDEIHRLSQPSQVLKIAADYFPHLKILATGSSTLGASARFRDTLTGRKSDIWLTPLNVKDLDDFGHKELEHRFLFGGLPPFFLEQNLPEREFQEWFDSFWAKDVMELFRLERRFSFLKLIELILMQSGGIFDATRFAKICEVSRPTISNYLSVLQATHVVHIIRPFSTRKANEIVAAPKIYGFDTGFICYFKGWNSLRPDDMGFLWEHFVLNEMHSQMQNREIHYWRDKQGHEIDFILKMRNKKPIAIECKWSESGFEPKNLVSFRNRYPGGTNFVVCHDVDTAHSRKIKNIDVTFINLPDFINQNR